MRLWSLDPSLLDARGLVAMWREALLALKVLKGQTRGYTRHPQLERFRATSDPVAAISEFLRIIHKESIKRGYQFNKDKIPDNEFNEKIMVTNGQVEFEFARLKEKCRKRDFIFYNKIEKEKPSASPLFTVIDGDKELWEKSASLEDSVKHKMQVKKKDAK